MEDRMSMAWSIESRLPFMDYRLVEMAFNLADDFKLADGFSKIVLRNAVKGKLPESIRSNPRKKRFNSPYRRWLRREWRPLVEDSLGSGCRLRDHMDLTGFSERLGRFFAGDPNVVEAGMLWRAVNAELFLRTFGEQPGRTGGEGFG